MRRWFCGLTVLGTGLACGGAFQEQEHALDASDHAVLIEIADLQAEFPTVAVDPTKESWSKVKALGTWELEYTYEADDFMLTSMVFLEETADDASWVMWGLDFAPAMLENEGIAFVEDGDLVTLGDEESCGLLEAEGTTVGNLCVVRDGGTVIALIVVGGFFDQPGDLDRILSPALAATKGYTPQPSPIP
jgi:hypothetical protein